ncbi:hypothetical protein [Niveibacterium umoris]|uniref:Uncharacterized protein n=1 Tax=Niveibacterium umoris TaxID=1193620 RepID=A0A840BM12_9RHOO|nr:hypothetical protein [Niveibacterium umoris]MBB4012598.1 hypothetical protein [Niveibacterium umoris]
MEERALAIALEKAKTPEQRAKVERLIALRDVLMQRRDSFSKDAVAKRHARGEIYSKARVAAINAMGPSKTDLEDNVNSLYLRQADSEGVLKAHARSHFAYVLVSARLQLAHMPPDIADAARDIQGHEESFAAAWIGAIGDAGFKTEIRQLQREALRFLRTSTRPMYLVTHPVPVAFDDGEAQDLGKAWNKLDDLALEIGVEPLSTFIALPDEEGCGLGSTSRILSTVHALIGALQTPGRKFPSKRAIGSVLTKIHAALLQLGETGGSAYFEVDI